jgi:hypothetical protein
MRLKLVRKTRGSRRRAEARHVPPAAFPATRRESAARASPGRRPGRPARPQSRRAGRRAPPRGRGPARAPLARLRPGAASSASSSTSSASTSTSPSRSASSAPTSSPVSTSRRAARGMSALNPFEIERPIATSGQPKRELSEATRTSQAKASSNAPPTQTPSTAASTGCGAATTSRVSRLKLPTARAHSSGVRVDVSRRSSPADQEPPSPKRTIARASLSPACASASPSAVKAARSHAFSRSGRDHRIQAVVPSRSRRTVTPARPRRRTHGRAASPSSPCAGGAPPGSRT